MTTELRDQILALRASGDGYRTIVIKARIFTGVNYEKIIVLALEIY